MFLRVFRKFPIAQKSLSRLEDRISNARETTLIKSLKTSYRRILVLDDAIGSGATLNEIARKIKSKSAADKIIGYAVVGSLKGFDVISVISCNNLVFILTQQQLPAFQ